MSLVTNKQVFELLNNLPLTIDKVKDFTFDQLTEHMQDSEVKEKYRNFIKHLIKLIDPPSEMVAKISTERLLTVYLITHFPHDVLHFKPQTLTDVADHDEKVVGRKELDPEIIALKLEEKDASLFKSAHEVLELLSEPRCERSFFQKLCYLIIAYQINFRLWIGKNKKDLWEDCINYYHQWKSTLDFIENIKSTHEYDEEFRSLTSKEQETLTEQNNLLISQANKQMEQAKKNVVTQGKQAEDFWENHPLIKKEISIKISPQLQQTVKELTQQAFWNMLEEELSQEPPQYDMLIRIFRDLYLMLQSLVKVNKKFKADLDDKLNPDFLARILTNGGMSPDQIYRTMMFVLDTVKNLQAQIFNKRLESYRSKLEDLLGKSGISFSQILPVFFADVFKMIEEIASQKKLLIDYLTLLDSASEEEKKVLTQEYQKNFAERFLPHVKKSAPSPQLQAISPFLSSMKSKTDHIPVLNLDDNTNSDDADTLADFKIDKIKENNKPKEKKKD